MGLQPFKRQLLVLKIAATFIANCGSFYYKLRQLIYYKTGQLLLQNVAAITKRDSFVTKYGNYYKIGRLLQKGP